ncbi:hypothetical protein B0H16DRAFT_1556741 [Mycena metata]|uniref:BRCT domain-containing protein n=1 Tax=Mycena metata TaxID=1033252 RepID=A0AAD7N6B9_9AGAR|nr:hypothetical protein B0H16DRAFT_1556741 [Mycena metata]
MVFRGVKYHIPATFPEPKRAELVRLLKEHHAKSANTVFDATHIITNSEDFKGCEQVNAGKVSVVTGLWVERSIAAKKMQSETYYSASPSKLFSGVIGCSADLFPGDEEVFAVTISALGGQWRVNPDKTTTHLFAMSRPSNLQFFEAVVVNPSIKVLLPSWFDDTLRLNSRDLSTKAYEWDTPNARYPKPDPLALPTTAYSSDVWSGRRILLSPSLKLTASRRRMVEDSVRNCHGVLVELMSDDDPWDEIDHLENKHCDVFITCRRAGEGFLQAWDTGITIGTLCWLLEMQATGILSGPRDRLLYFPHPPGDVSGIEGSIICLSHYEGESAQYLQRLIRLMGGLSTPKLVADTAILVTANPCSRVVTKAAERSIPIVNHLWLEDCFIRWEKLDSTLPKYTLFPADVDCGAEVGDRGLGEEIEEIIATERKKWHW